MDSVAREQVAVKQIKIAKGILDGVRIYFTLEEQEPYPDDLRHILNQLDEASGQLAESLEVLEM